MALTREGAGSKTARMKRPQSTVITSPAVALVIGLAILCQSGPASAARPELPGVSLGDLDDTEVALLVEILDAQFDPCGKPRSLMEAVKDSATCATAPKLANYAVGQIQRGLSKRQVVKELLKEQKRLTVKHDFSLTGRPSIGSASAKVTVVEFFDFQCPHCKTVASKVANLVKSKGARIVYKQFPLEFHPAAKTAAVFAVAAHSQGKWEAVHDLLFANQDKLDDALVEKLTKESGADMAKLQSAKAAATTMVEQDRREGDAAGLEGTPTFFVNGRMVDYEELEGAIDEALKGGG